MTGRRDAQVPAGRPGRGAGAGEAAPASAPGDVPVLETARLRLRLPDLGDWPAYRETLTAPRARCMGGPYDLPGAWGLFCHEIVCRRLFGCGALAFERKEGGPALGTVQINGGPLHPEPELGWMVWEAAEGRGYVTEAAAALRAWAFAVRGLPTLVSCVDPDNARSIAVARRLGATLDPHAPRLEPTDLIFRHPRP